MVNEILHVKYLNDRRHKSIGKSQEKDIIGKPTFGINKIFRFQKDIDQNGNQDRIDYLRDDRFYSI
jgi:hypothetical protein